MEMKNEAFKFISRKKEKMLNNRFKRIKLCHGYVLSHREYAPLGTNRANTLYRLSVCYAYCPAGAREELGAVFSREKIVY